LLDEQRTKRQPYRLSPPLPGKMTPLHSDHFHHQGA
jgi:hypothetical protein